jgi:molybdopterin molybdotransferase
MTSEEDALAAVLAKVRALPSVKAALADSLGRFAAQDAFALRPLPAFDNSAMDGYALQADSCRAGVKFRVVGEQPAGADRGLVVGAGEAIRIFTGAPLPLGANAVIMQEDVTREGETIVVQGNAEAGEFIRRQGSDLAAGQKFFHAESGSRPRQWRFSPRKGSLSSRSAARHGLRLSPPAMS